MFDASYNLISDLSDLEHCVSLKRLNLSYNKIEDIDNLIHLSFLNELEELSLDENPISRLPNFNDLIKTFNLNENIKYEFTYTEQDLTDNNNLNKSMTITPTTSTITVSTKTSPTKERNKEIKETEGGMATLGKIILRKDSRNNSKEKIELADVPIKKSLVLGKSENMTSSGI